ncbi:hypothetical protein PUW24_26345 [Paenibacillus urinalis]|uniref:N-terminal domain of peptidoglycan hydrolase CwlO-containing protein n=1 Tax=Paenibacillus urinalis TaxID=521520 RepID=A0AAX3MVC3_9BACL|nr:MULTISPECIES: hypothetical protein [Paenibacillus]WDH81545.1 hypothetical protein PUW23_18750 [Paenibacillus urinalis]WDH97590.1 hypothetical protein PUW24_26345 [Paenibacillus urinalis]GAK39675.1 hypothetical protein TCA2_2164 [Paenibacillus sp. TCA20]
MRNRSTYYVIVCCSILLILLHISPIHAEPAMDETTRDVLQNSLSIVEIDHEIERIEVQQQQIEDSRVSLEAQMSVHKEEMEAHQDRAASIVRSYYMGERDQLLQVFLKAKSLRSIQILASYYEIIIGRDQEVLHAYHSRQQEFEEMTVRLNQNDAELSLLKQNLQDQRERVLTLEQEVENTLASSDNRELMEKLIEELNTYWSNVGIHEVKRYFGALASAMNNLPSFVQQEKGILSTNGRTYSIRINEEQLNDFLRSENEIFNDFAFEFTDDYIIASGKRDNLELAVQGHYTVIDEPANALLFHVDKLVFNGFELPDTTRSMLQQEFDLGFYPQKLMSFIKATDVSTEDQTLEVTLELALR